jgi:hypothetical protein
VGIRLRLLQAEPAHPGRAAKANPQLRIVTVAAERSTADTGPAINKTGVKSERLAYGDDVPEALAYAIDPNWRGELPRTYLFDGKGGVQALLRAQIGWRASRRRWG